MKTLDSSQFNWKRYWCKQDELVTLDDSGFLFDPETKESFYKKTDVLSFTEISNLNCLVLLGEPGIGKSTTLQNEFLNHKKQKKSNELCLFKNLNEYGDENRLIKEIFNAQEFDKWLKSDKNLYLYLDSFDECLLEIKRLFQILKNQFSKYNEISSRFYLRITCRTGYWSECLTDFFNNLFGADNVGTYELAPLKKSDIEEAAEKIGLNASRFIEEIITKEIQPLAINPLTLDLLFQSYIHSTSFPSSKEELFYSACKRLCTEPNFERQLLYQTNSLSPEKRIALASRIAAVMLFCDKRVVDLRNNFELSVDAISIDILLEGKEYTDNFEFPFSQRDLIETITQTSLFSSRGDLQFGFSHLAYSEFLAAKFISNHGLEIEQIKSLITLSTDEENKIIPQMKGVAAWMSMINSKVAEDTIKNDPQNILIGDLDILSLEYKEKLVNSLLEKLSNNTIDDGDWGLHKQYKKLNHPTLSEQLKPYIVNKDSYFLARRVAIDIAEACRLTELNPNLIDLALDESEDIHARSNAVHALIETGDIETKKKLIPLATLPQELDKDDDIKAYSLIALWPEILSTSEVFEVLTPPKRSNYSGGYVFFMYLLQDGITKDDLDGGLSWILKNISTNEDNHYRFDNLEDVIINLSWENINNIKDKSLFAKVLLLRMQKYQTIFPTPQRIGKQWNPIVIDNNTRFTVFKELIEVINDEEVHFLTHNELINKDNFDDIIDIFLKTESPESKLKIAKTLNYFYYSEFNHIDKILTLCEEYEEFKNAFSPWLKTIEIGSDEAKKLKQSVEQRKEWEQKSKERKQQKEAKKIDMPLRLTKDLENFEKSHSVTTWYQLFMDLTLTETSTHYGDELNSSVLNLPGWEYVDESLRERIIESAKYYISHFDDKKSEWFGTNTFYRPATAGYKSLILLYKLDKHFIIDLSSDTWAKWNHILVDYPESYGIAGKDETYIELISISYQKNRQSIIDVILEKIDKANSSDDNYLTFLNKVDTCMDKYFQDALLEKLKVSELRTQVSTILLSKLLEKGNSNAISYNIKLFRNSSGNDKVLYAKSLASFCDNKTWEIIMEAIKSNMAFGKDFFFSFADTYVVNMTPLLERISEIQSADLFLWLIEAFPREEDPVFEGAHMVGARESVGNFRDQILRILTAKGTKESILALDKIKTARKDLNIEFYLVAAKKNFRANNWAPLTPKEFLTLATNSNVRVVLNSQDLMNLILDSLSRLEISLQGSNSLSGVLWDKINSGNYLPKSEEHLSDYIKQHLDRELKSIGISSYREVQLRKPNFIPDGKKGEVTDIYVSFTHPETKESFNVIIEVKGSNNQEVNTNMKEQLSDRYLETDQCKYGIYLVAWYNCKAYKKQVNKTQQSTLLQARKHYKEMASKLNGGEKIIKSFVLDCSLKN